jgi:hypothetical protein
MSEQPLNLTYSHKKAREFFSRTGSDTGTEPTVGANRETEQQASSFRPSRVAVYRTIGSSHLGSASYTDSPNRSQAYKVTQRMFEWESLPKGDFYEVGGYGDFLKQQGLINFEPPRDYAPLTQAQFQQLVDAGIELARRNEIIAKAEATDQVPFNERNPGQAVNVMWPVKKMESGAQVEAGVSLGQYRNSFYRTSTYLAGSIAYQLPKSSETGFSASVGAEVGRITGYKNNKVMGQVYGELCKGLSENLSVCAKIGVVPTRYTVPDLEALAGQDIRDKPNLTYKNKWGSVTTQQIGLSYRF